MSENINLCVHNWHQEKENLEFEPIDTGTVWKGSWRCLRCGKRVKTFQGETLAQALLRKHLISLDEFKKYG